ncbi:hypothetical protein EYR40_000662 [Pleurotus pulmonarius]|nr:hypothetical protein EYR40_000662 [Pleurotus pulmonarius]
MATDLPSSQHPNDAALKAAMKGFDHLFSNDIVGARKEFAADHTPFHWMGLGACAFLQAALGMEASLMAEATHCLTKAEAESKSLLRSARSSSSSRFPQGTEWEILNADAVVLLGLTHALSESYMGYLQCLYSLNSAHGKFTKLYKTVFPTGLDHYSTPATTPAISRNASNPNLAVPIQRSSFFGRWTRPSGSMLSVPSSPSAPGASLPLDGPVEELIVSGTAFGYGLFNLVFSLLPKKVQSVVGFFGFKHDRKLALQALAVAAAKSDVHSVFAGLVLMTYYGVVLLMSGYQADEAHIVKQYRAIVDKIESKYPTGALWILNRAKILRMTHDPQAAIHVLQEGLGPDREFSFVQADTLLVFELAWTLLSQRRYQEAADMFIKLTELNSWSRATYYFIAAGCYVSLGNRTKAQSLFDAIPDLVNQRKINGKDLPTEVLIKKKLEFYKAKQVRRGGPVESFVDAIAISPAEELGIFWNNHARIENDIAHAHILEWASLSPPVSIDSPHIKPNVEVKGTAVDLDTPDELALRSLLLGVTHRTVQEFKSAREFLVDAHGRRNEMTISTWIPGVAMFELAVLDLKELEAREKVDIEEDPTTLRSAWGTALDNAIVKLDQAYALAPTNVDLSSRLDTRIAMLRDEIGLKREKLGLH